MTHSSNDQVSSSADSKPDDDYFGYYYHTPGAMPGDFEIAPDAKPSYIELIDYYQNEITYKTNISPEDCIHYLEKDGLTWIDVNGLGSRDILNRVGKVFNLHRLLLEDVVNVPQRPRCEDYAEKLLIIAQVARLKKDAEGFETEQVSFIIGNNYLLTFQEDAIHDPFLIIKEQIRVAKGQLKETGVDYLAYRLIDSIIEGYFPILEHYEDRIEDLEEKIIKQPDRSDLEEIYWIRRELIALRRLIWPLRDILNVMSRAGYDNINPDVRVYFRDCYEHVIQLLEIIESYRELASSLMEVYLSSISNRVNEVMKFLTVISTIFIPLTFIAGVYGMNFENMPELKWEWSYFVCLFVMLVIALGLVYFFWKRGWFKKLF